MKKRLTLEIFLSILSVVGLTIFIWLAANVISVQADIGITDSFYNLKFSPNKLMEKYISCIKVDDEKVIIDEEEIKELEENGAWIQILNNNNEEIYNYNKPDSVPEYYTVGEFSRLSNEYWEVGNSTLFSKGFQLLGEKYSIVLGCKFTNVMRKSYIYTVENMMFNFLLYGFGIVITVIVAYLFSLRLSRPINRIIEKIKLLSEGDYIESNKEQDVVYKSLDENIYLLSERLKKAEKERMLIENSRNEWISNITHDLKTPLASIQGYSEILKSEKYSVSNNDRIEYSRIILSKVNYISELIEDLKLTYQLKTKEIPLKAEMINIVDLVREIIIDILNNPNYDKREIKFNCKTEIINLYIDKHYMERAIKNLIYNAVIHNSEDTIIEVSIGIDKNICLEICDNGNGINEEELKYIFERYYRGTNTGDKHKGSGLGMAISKEIIEANNGRVKIESELGKGTKIKMEF